MGPKSYDIPLMHRQSKQRRRRKETKKNHHCNLTYKMNVSELIACMSGTGVDRAVAITCQTY